MYWKEDSSRGCVHLHYIERFKFPFAEGIIFLGCTPWTLPRLNEEGGLSRHNEPWRAYVVSHERKDIYTDFDTTEKYRCHPIRDAIFFKINMKPKYNMEYSMIDGHSLIKFTKKNCIPEQSFQLCWELL